jgi:uncharacterized membrane protein
MDEITFGQFLAFVVNFIKVYFVVILSIFGITVGIMGAAFVWFMKRRNKAFNDFKQNRFDRFPL